MVKEGDKFICIKTVEMEETGEEAYTKDKIYICEIENCLTDNQGAIEHYVIENMGKGSDRFLKEYFEPYDVKLPVSGDIGVKETNGKLSYELDFEFITQMAERMDANKGKYVPYNWQKPIDTKGLHKALARHFFAVMKGEYEDEGREFGHLEALALNAMMINYQLKNNK
jgi:hypothetical protein